MAIVRPAQPYKFTGEDYNTTWDPSGPYGLPVEPYSWTQYHKQNTRTKRNLVRPACSIGRGTLVLFTTDNPAYSLSNYNNDVAEVRRNKLDTDMLCVFFWDSASNHLPIGSSMPDYIYWEENLTASPSLADFKRLFNNTISDAGVINREIQDVVIFCSWACTGGKEEDIADAMDSTGFIAWLENIAGVNVWKARNSVIAAWYRTLTLIYEAHSGILDTLNFYWTCP